MILWQNVQKLWHMYYKTSLVKGQANPPSPRGSFWVWWWQMWSSLGFPQVPPGVSLVGARHHATTHAPPKGSQKHSWTSGAGSGRGWLRNLWAQTFSWKRSSWAPPQLWVCASLCCKNLCCASCFCRLGRGAGGSRSKNFLDWSMKQVLVQGHTLRLLDETRGPGISSARNQKLGQSGRVSTCWINPGGLLLELPPLVASSKSGNPGKTCKGAMAVTETLTKVMQSGSVDNNQICVTLCRCRRLVSIRWWPHACSSCGAVWLITRRLGFHDGRHGRLLLLVMFHESCPCWLCHCPVWIVLRRVVPCPLKVCFHSLCGLQILRNSVDQCWRLLWHVNVLLQNFSKTGISCELRRLETDGTDAGWLNKGLAAELAALLPDGGNALELGIVFCGSMEPKPGIFRAAAAAGELERFEGIGHMLASLMWCRIIPGAHVKKQRHAGGNSKNHLSLPANGNCARSLPYIWICMVSVSGLRVLMSLNKSCHFGVFNVRRAPYWFTRHVTLKKVGGFVRDPGKIAKTSLQLLCLGSHINWCFKKSDLHPPWSAMCDHIIHDR